MNKIKTLKILTKLATELDNIGRHNEANFVDNMIVKLAEDLQPVSEVYEKNGKFYRKFYSSSKGLIVKEVDKSGNIIGNPNQPIPQNSTQPNTNKELQTGEQDKGFWDGFYDLISALRGNPPQESGQKVEVKDPEK